MTPARPTPPKLGPRPIRGGEVRLRAASPDDLEVFFEIQREPAGRWMLGFGAPDPNHREDFLRKWTGHLANEEIQLWAVLERPDGGAEERVVGNAMTFYRSSEEPLEVGYSLTQTAWGRGIASQVVALMLEETSERPLAARCIHDNVASIRVLEKNGFVETARATAFGHARGAEVEEIFFRLYSKR